MNAPLKRTSRNQDRARLTIGTQTFADASRLVFQIPRDYDYETIGIRFAGTAHVTTNFASVRAEAPLQALASISLSANGDLLDGLTGILAHRMSVLRKGQLPPLSVPSGFVVADYAFAGTVLLDRSVIDGIRPKDAAFPSRGLTTFDLNLVMGSCADLFTGAGVGTITGGTVEVFATKLKETVGPDGKRSSPRAVAKRSYFTESFAASNAAYEKRINSGNLFRGLVMRAYGVTAGEPSNAVINRAKLMKGNEVVFDWSGNVIRDQNAADYQVTTMPTGLYVLDLMAMGSAAGKLTDCLDLRRSTEEVKLVLDVTGGANVKIDVATLEYADYVPSVWNRAA